MKNLTNLKNIVSATTLTAVLMISATSAQAGILMSDRAASGQSTQMVSQQCSQEEPGFFGLLVSDLTGLLVSDSAGLLMSDSADCQQEISRDGLLVSD